MVFTADQTARNAENAVTNKVGFCLQECRTWAGIPALWGTAALAANNATNMQRNRDIPRGAFAFWVGGSDGSGHIAVGLGAGLLRSTDAEAPGRVGTRTLDWFDQNWNTLTYVGWADNVNGVTVPGVGDWFAMATEAELRAIVREEIAANAPVPPSAGDIAKAVGALFVRNESKTQKGVSLRAAIRETYEKVTGR